MDASIFRQWRWAQLARGVAWIQIGPELDLHRPMRDAATEEGSCQKD